MLAHLHWDFFQLPAVQTQIVEGPTGGWESMYAEGLLKTCFFQLYRELAPLTHTLLFKGQL